MMNSTTSSIFLALVVLLSAPFAVTGQFFQVRLDSNETAAPTVPCKSIADILCEPGAGLKAFCEAISISELNDDLDEDYWTVFSPTDEAFEALGRDNLDSLVFGNDTVPLTDLLLFHIVPGVSLTSDLLPCEAGLNLLDMANGDESRTLCVGGIPAAQKGEWNDREGSPTFLEMDIKACNGVIHILDKVMLYEPLPFDIPEERPPPETENPLLTVGTAAPEITAPPTESATTETPTTSPTSGSTTDSPTVSPTVPPTVSPTAGTPTASPVDQGTAPPSDTADTDSVTTDYIDEIVTVDEDEQCLTIADIVCSNAAFSTLCTLLRDYGLAEDLRFGTWTVFAPTNAAFDDAPRLLTDIEFILLEHVVAGQSLAFEDLECTERIAMANGKDTRTVCVGDVVYQKGMGNAIEQRPQILQTNLAACNGMVHVVDQVILP